MIIQAGESAIGYSENVQAVVQNVLITGVSSSSLDRLRPALEQSGLKVESVPNITLAIGRVASQRYAVIVVGFGTNERSEKRLLEMVRSPGGPCQRSGLLLLAQPGQIGPASTLVGAGVNKVLSAVEEPSVVACVVKRLSGSRHPLAERLRSNIEIKVNLREGEHTWRAANVSAAGLLIQTNQIPDVGSRFAFSLKTEFGLIVGEAKVVRHTRPDREEVRGFGARFCSFQGDGRQVLASFLRSLRVAQGPGIG
ncbi:MAG: PilZ domain-containing protein [bacterium]|nr:PilZ domain-containing protein [bacterium]